MELSSFLLACYTDDIRSGNLEIVNLYSLVGITVLCGFIVVNGMWLLMLVQIDFCKLRVGYERL